jgi:flagellar hook-length control protein FliK
MAMQIQQLMNLASTAEAGGPTARPAGDGAAFARTLAGALEGSGSLSEAAKTLVAEWRQANPAQSGEALPQALARLQAQWAQRGAGEGDNAGSLLAMLDGAASGDSADAGALAGILERLSLIQTGAAGSMPSGESATARSLTDQLTALRERLSQIQGSGETASDARGAAVDEMIEQLDALQARMNGSGEALPDDQPALAALLQGLNAELATQQGTAARAGEAMNAPVTAASGEAARSLQAAIDRTLAEQAQTLRQATAERGTEPQPQSTNARTGDPLTRELFASLQSEARGQEGMNGASREAFNTGLSPMAGSLTTSTPNPGMTPSVASASLSAPVGTPAWEQQLSQQMIRFSQQGGEQRVTLRLHPAELGPVSVNLTMNDQNAQAQFLSHNATVRQALEQALPQLRDALAEQGISLGETSVGEQSAGDGDAGDDGASGPAVIAGGATDGDAAGDDGTAATTTHDIGLDGRVDLYA